ncbi:MAG TPA: hypothetical protein VGH83_04075 [Candidatus Acidoferrum sp.]
MISNSVNMSVRDSGFGPEGVSRESVFNLLKGSMRVIREDENIRFPAAKIVPVNFASATQFSDEQVFEANHFVEIIQGVGGPLQNDLKFHNAATVPKFDRRGTESLSPD